MKKISNFSKIVLYTIALTAFSLKIGMELYFDYSSGEILWPAIGMMWCITAGINESRIK